MTHKQRAALAEPGGSAGRSRPARGRLLEAARELARTSGYEQLQVSELTARAQVSRETFYTHFADKRACLIEACDPELAAIATRLSAAAEQDRPWAGPLLAALDETLGGLYDSPESIRSRLLEAMLRAVADKGYAATRLVEVIRSAGASYPAFYRRFATKGECFAAAYRSLLDELGAGLASQAAPASSSAALLAALGERLAADPTKVRILIGEAGWLPAAPPADPTLAHAHSLAELLGELLFGAESSGATNPAALPSGRSLAVGAILETLRAAVVGERIDGLADELAALAPLVDPTLGGERGACADRAARRRRGGHARRRVAGAAG